MGLSMAKANNSTPFNSVPDDVLQRLLVGVPLGDHRAAASACRSFRDVINGPRFPALRRKYGFAEYGVVVVDDTLNGVLKIRMAHQNGAKATISSFFHLVEGVSTTDGATRLFVCTWRSGPQILSLDASSRQWRHVATLPRNYGYHSIEWHDGRLYFAGGRKLYSGHQYEYHNSLHAFDEATGLWEELPPMPHACANAASGVIGNELFIAGGAREGHAPYGADNAVATRTLQIYDITTRTWRFGALLPYQCYWETGVVVDEKLFVFRTADPRHGMLAYDPQSDTWSEEAVPFVGIVEHACAHTGRVVVFLRNGTAFERAADGAWSPFSYGLREEDSRYEYATSGSVLLG